MKSKCLEIGQIQAYLDGELDPELITGFAVHLGECEKCALAFEQAESESLTVFSALGGELDTLVPTQRLWERISSEIESGNKRQSILGRLAGLLNGIVSLEGLAAAAAAVIVVTFGMAYFIMEQPGDPQSGFTAATSSQSEKLITSGSTSGQETPNQAPSAVQNDFVASSTLKDSEIRRMVSQPAVQRERGQSAAAVREAFLPGEESYIKTIRGLEQGIGAQAVSLSVSGQVGLERDLAVIDASINKMREVVRRNPKDRAARRILYAAYQDKIDILNSAAQRQELMASIR